MGGRSAPRAANQDRIEQEVMAVPLNREEALARVGGDESLLRELAGLFLEEYPKLLSATQAALAQGQLPKVASSAHQMKGLLAQFAAEPARQNALQLEMSARGGDQAACQEQLGRIEATMAELLPLLQTMAGL